VFGNPIEDFGKHDAFDLSGLHFHSHAKATYDALTDQLTVHSGAITDTLTLLSPKGTHFAVTNDGHGGTEVTLAPPHHTAAVASSLSTDEPTAQWAGDHLGNYLFAA
jgi:hypothetical protein